MVFGKVNYMRLKLWNRKKKMTLWHKLLFIMIMKLTIMFAVVKPLFFPNFMKTNFETKSEKEDFIIQQITNTSNSSFKSIK